MKNILKTLLMLLVPVLGAAQSAQRVSTALLPSGTGGTYAAIVPNASVSVCQFNTSTQCTTPIAVYSDQQLTHAIVQPIVANAAGVYSYFVASGTQVVEKVCNIYNQCSSVGLSIGTFGSGGATSGGNFALSQYNSATGSILYPSEVFLDQLSGQNMTVGTGNGNGSIKSATIGGIRYSTQWGGLLPAMASKQTIITDPTDITTSTAYTFSSPPPGVPANFVWTDNRQLNYTGIQEVIEDWGFNRGSSFSGDTAARALNCMVKRPSNYSLTGETFCFDNNYLDTAPGKNIGNYSVIPTGIWDVSIASNINILRFGGGITESETGSVTHTGDGDTAGARHTTTSWGGEVDASGEGNEAITGGASEGTTQFQAVISSITSTTLSPSATQITLTTPKNGASNTCVFGSFSSPCYLGVGRPLVDVTQGPTANTVTNITAGIGTGLEAVTVGTPISTASNAYGTLTSNIIPSAASISGPPYFSSVSFTVGSITGGFVINTPICFSSQMWDVGWVTGVTLNSGVATIQANVYKPHAGGSGSIVMQGGPCGQGIEITASTIGNNSYLGYVIGATTTSVLQVTWFRTVGASTTPFSSGLFTAGLLYGSASVTKITSNGTTVLFSGALNGTLGYPNTNLNKQSIIFSGASDSALNGNVCTNVTWLSTVVNSTGIGTCTMASLGANTVHSATTASYILASAAGNPIANVNLWNIAHVVDVQDESVSPPAINGTITLMVNSVNWNVGDTVRQFNHEALEIEGGKFNVAGQNPYALTRGISSAVGGLAATGGGNSAVSNALLALSNTNLDSVCLDGGGLYPCANAINVSGPYNIGLNYSEGPHSSQPWAYIQTTTTQRSNPAYNYFFLNSTDSGAGTTININPSMGDTNILTRGQLGLGGTGANVHFNSNSDSITFNDRINFSAVTTPTGLACVQGPGSGTLADGTYYYTIGARTNSGFVIPSTEVPVTVASTPSNNNSVKCTWNRVKGVDVAYQLYGRATGAELLLASPTQLFFIDDGSLTPSGSMPTTNTTLGFVDQAASLGLNSLNTAFEAVIKTPSSVAASYNLGLPATGTAGTLVDMASSTSTVGAMPTYSNTTGRLQNNSGFIPAIVTSSIIPAAATTSQCAEQTFTFTNLITGHPVMVSPPGVVSAHVWIGWARVSSSNTLAIGFCADATGGTPVSGSYIAEQF